MDITERGEDAWRCLRRRCRCVVSVRLSLSFSVSRSALGSCLLPNVTHQFFSIHTVHLFTRKTLIRRRSTRHPPQRPSLLALSSQVSHSFMRYTISRGSAHSSLSLDVGVAVTPIPHSNPISPYTTSITLTRNRVLANN